MECAAPAALSLLKVKAQQELRTPNALRTKRAFSLQLIMQQHRLAPNARANFKNMGGSSMIFGEKRGWNEF